MRKKALDEFWIIIIITATLIDFSARFRPFNIAVLPITTDVLI